MTAAPSPSSSATMVPPPSSSTTSVPTKKKISIQEYNCHKAAEQQLVATYLDRDENGEELDYKDFELQDDPANLQIGYRTPDANTTGLRSPTTARCLKPSTPISCHPSSPRFDYSNAPRQHQPRHCTKYNSTQCCHCS